MSKKIITILAVISFVATVNAYGMYDSFNPSGDEGAVVTENGNWLEIDPSQSGSDVKMTWDNQISRGEDKKIVHKMNFDQKGHTRIEYRNSDGLVANFNTDATGTDAIYFYCYTCDENQLVNDGVFETAESDGYGRLPVDYSTGHNYTFEAVRRDSSNEIEFTIYRNDEYEVWSHTRNNINDFGWVNLETWQTWGGGSTAKPDYSWRVLDSSLEASSTTVKVGDTVDFYPGKQDEDGPSNFEWLWPDGTGTWTTSDDPQQYTFDSAGTKTVELTTEESGGSREAVSTVGIEVESCDYFLYRPESKTVTLGDDTYFQVWHDNSGDCPAESEVKFEVCGQNYTSSDGIVNEQDRTNDFFQDQYPKAFNATFNTETDVNCESASSPVRFYDNNDNLVGDSHEDDEMAEKLQLVREETVGTPIHENGNYKPDSEIIVATQMERASFYNPSQGDFANRSDTFFFACRGQYRGESISDSKLVKVQEGDIDNYEWQHYRCAMNGSWMEANCEPGEEIRNIQDEEGYGCFLKDSQTIHATYFDIQEIPYTGRDEGYLAGFKITENEIDQYEDVMGFQPQKVDAECWMGEDNERPVSVDNSTVFTSTYDGSGDLYAIAEVPGREGVNQETYSCVWGMKNVGSTADTNVYESTNNDPLLAKDGGKTEITYNTIESRYAGSDIDEGTPRTVWADYQHPTDGGLDQRTYELNNHFFLNGEYPYCSGNNFFSSNPQRTTDTLSNIICEGDGGFGEIS